MATKQDPKRVVGYQGAEGAPIAEHDAEHWTTTLGDQQSLPTLGPGELLNALAARAFGQPGSPTYSDEQLLHTLAVTGWTPEGSQHGTGVDSVPIEIEKEDGTTYSAEFMGPVLTKSQQQLLDMQVQGVTIEDVGDPHPDQGLPDEEQSQIEATPLS